MEYNDRELLVYRIRSGSVTIKIEGKTLKTNPPSIQGHLDSCEEYWRIYEECLAQGLKTQDEMLEWMMEEDLWSYYEEDQLLKIKEKLEDTRLKAYENRRNQMSVNACKNQLRALERQFKRLSELKHKYYAATCDGMASSVKTAFLVENNTYCDGEKYNFAEVSLEQVTAEVSQFHDIEDSMIRYLARSEPWRTIWSTRANTSSPLFLNESNIDLTINQKSLLAWSQMYDNVYESMECPDKYVIDDDDLLDGWFVQQSRKRERDQAKQDLDKSIKNEKIRNAQEVYSVVKNVDEFRKVDSLNNTHSRIVKKQRENLIKEKGGTGQGAFHDEKLKYVAQQNKQFKGKFGG